MKRLIKTEKGSKIKEPEKWSENKVNFDKEQRFKIGSVKKTVTSLTDDPLGVVFRMMKHEDLFFTNNFQC